MTSVCLYFQVHQPFRLKPYSFIKIGHDPSYEATALNVEIINRVSDLCYLPSNALLQKLIEQHDGKFKVSFSITGTCLEQLSRHRPDVIDSFRKLGETGCVEFLCETYYHSLASLYSPFEFERQVKMHEKAVNEILGFQPKVFRNTELLYQNGLTEVISNLGFEMVLAEGAAKNLHGKSPNHIFTATDHKTKVLARNFGLSDDIAFRLSDQSWNEFPLTPAKFASWIHKLEDAADSVNLFMDYETFGEHRKSTTGIFDFMDQLPAQVLQNKNFTFANPSDWIDIKTGDTIYDAPEWTSWADEDKDSSAWTEDFMQRDALQKIYTCENRVKELNQPEILDTWSKLQTSDHFYYMSARYRYDPTHKNFNHYQSPYDAYLNYMNILSDFKIRIGCP